MMATASRLPCAAVRLRPHILHWSGVFLPGETAREPSHRRILKERDDGHRSAELLLSSTRLDGEERRAAEFENPSLAPRR